MNESTPHGALVRARVRPPGCDLQSARPRRFTALLAASTLVLSIPFASAVVVNPGDTKPLSGTTTAASPEHAGPVIRDELHNFTIRDGSKNVLVSGVLQERVSRSDKLGTLLFTYRLRDLTAPGTARIVGVSRTGFRRVSRDAEYHTDGLGDVGPESVSCGGDGNTLTFSHQANTIDPPDESYFTVVLTDAPSYDLDASITISAKLTPVSPEYSVTINNISSPGALAVNAGQSIQWAIDHADPGDTVVVGPGTYVEDLVLRSNVNVAGAGADDTILEGVDDGSVVIADRVTNSEFTGFTVQGGMTGVQPAGFKIYGGSPVIKGNTIQNNESGIMLVDGSTAIISGNIIQDNGVEGGTLDYGIIILDGSAPLVTNNLVLRNEAGIYLFTTGVAQIINNTVADNSSSGIWAYNVSAPVIKNNLSTANNTGISASHGAMPVCSYNNVWGNTWKDYDEQSGGVVGPRTGSISADPLLGSGFTLEEGSPCIDAGDPAAIYNDVDGSRNDIGWTGGPSGSAMPPGAVVSGFVWTSIGTYANIEDIAQTGAKRGLTKDRDRPFGGSPWLSGAFGFTESGVFRYAVKIAPWNGGSAPSSGDFEYVDDPLSKVRYDLTGGTVTSTRVALGPAEWMGRPTYSLTRNTGNIIWAHENLRIVLNTLGLANGTYSVRMEALNNTGSVIPFTVNEDIIMRVNNTRPLVSIDSVSYNGGPAFSECSFVSLPSDTSTLDFEYTAHHADGFLDNYQLLVQYGRNRSGGNIVTDDYSAHTAANGMWNGETNTMVAATPVSPAQPLPALQPWRTCAYQFRIRAWARTTNGFGRLYWTSFFDTYVIDLRPPVTSGPDLDGDGDVDAADLAIMADAYGTAP